MRITEFIDRHYRHFNAAALKDAADGYIAHLEGGGRMLMALAGAMSTAELGISLAEMIRQGKVHAISCTGANLEEDVFNLVAHDHYRRIPHFRNLKPHEEKELEHRGLNRVTDTCIPESEAFRALEKPLVEVWQQTERAGQRLFPHQFLYKLLLEGGSGGELPDRSARLLDARRRPSATCRSSCPAGKTRRWATSSRRT